MDSKPQNLQEEVQIIKSEEQPAQKEDKKRSRLIDLARKLNINLEPLLKTTKFCKHDFGCLENIISGTVQAVLIGYSVNTSINIIALGLIKQKFKLLLKSLISKETFVWVGFLSIYTLVLKTVTCALRHLRKKNDQLNDFLAGALAGACSISLLGKEQRLVWSGYLLARTLDAIYNNLVNRGVIKKSKFHYIFVYGLMYALYGYSILSEPDIMPRSLQKFFDNYMAGVFTPNLNEFILIMRERKRRYWNARGKIY